MQRGKLIVIEGGDAAGKATQVALLTSRLLSEGYLITQMNFPQYENNHIGKLLRECLDGRRGDFLRLDPKIASVLYSVDRLESKNQIEMWLNEGKHVLLDRYSTANVFHQGAKVSDQHVRFETMHWIRHLEHDVLKLPIPDKIFTLPVPAAIRAELRRQQNRTKGRMIDLADQNQVHQQLVDVALADLPSIYDNVEEIHTMDGDELRSPEAIHQDIYASVKNLLSAV
jgi:dTMP kinase